MYTAYIGRRLVDLLNTRDQSQRTVSEFFSGEYFELFFDNERYLQHVNNSKFDQAYKQKGKSPLTLSLRATVLAAQQTRIENDAPDGSFFLGGAAAEVTAGTSGQVTDIQLPVSPDEVYASWIGAALGIGVSGGMNVLVDNDDVLLALYDGWKFYRRYLTQSPDLKPHQVNTWNGWWITNVFRYGYDPANPFENQPDVKVDKTSGGAVLETQKWVKVVFSIARKLSGQTSLTTYVYALSQMNTTVGYIQIKLPEIVSVERELRRQLFARRGNLNDEAIDDLYNTEMGFQKACTLGAIGIQTLEPESLREYMPKPAGGGKPLKSPKTPNDSLWITYTIYQTWLIAMLDNQQLLTLSEEIAQMLASITDVSQRGKKTNYNLVLGLVESESRPKFLGQLAELTKAAPEQHELLDQAGNTIATLPIVQMPLFMALLKLKYAVAEAKQKLKS